MSLTKEDPLIWLYKTPKKDTNSIINAIESVLFKLDYGVYTLILSSKDDVFNILDSIKVKNFSHEKKKLGEDIYSYSLSKKLRGKERIRKSRFIIFKHSYPNIYILLTHESYTIFNDDIISFIQKFYPKIARTYVDSIYMKEILENLEKHVKELGIRIIWVSFRNRITDKEAKRFYETGVKWTDILYKDYFKEVVEKDIWINTINFTFMKPSHELEIGSHLNYSDVTCQISRYGFFKCNKMYDLFYNTIGANIIEKALEDLNFFDNRQRIKEEKLRPKPIVIEYNIDLFKDKNQNKKFIEVLQKVTYSSLSILHSNPYLHCSFVDFRDGSSYEIWILSNKEITIVPQMRSTYASLERLCHHIFIGLREGIIKSYRMQ